MKFTIFIRKLSIDPAVQLHLKSKIKITHFVSHNKMKYFKILSWIARITNT